MTPQEAIEIARDAIEGSKLHAGVSDDCPHCEAAAMLSKLGPFVGAAVMYCSSEHLTAMTETNEATYRESERRWDAIGALRAMLAEEPK